MAARAAIWLSSALALAACRGHAADLEPPAAAGDAEADAHPLTEIRGFADTVAHRGALLLPEDPYDDAPSQVVYLDQNWGPAETLWFYYADQGSRLIPRDVLLNLEAHDSQAPLASPETFARYRFLNQTPTPNNPDGLPVGFARDGEHVGLTCAACHTGQIWYGGTAIRVDGAPAMVDMVGFFGTLQASLAATLADEEKFARFARAAGAEADEERDSARMELERAEAYIRTFSANFAESPPGPGRFDAMGAIYAQVARATSGSARHIPGDAATNYPLLWDAPRHDYVQWTGFSPNAGAGALGRNTGQAVGVFGQLSVTPMRDEADLKAGFDSSVNARNLVAMEEALWDLQSPVWPEDVLPPIDRERAEAGAALYEANCRSCHALLERDDPKRLVTAQIYGVDVVGTDPRAADSVVDTWLPTGVLEGSLNYDGTRIYGAEARALELLASMVYGILSQRAPAAVRTMAFAKTHGLEETDKQGDYAPNSDADRMASIRSYKARPLNGAWASSPYLHNGSVPTLYDLLLPPEQRPERFALGRWTYDPERVGYVSDGDAPFELDTTLPGNSNAGHAYGTELSEAERLALLEYLKTL